MLELQFMNIHPTAVVDPEASISPDTQVGPYCVIGKHVTLGPGNILKSHVNLQGPLRVGANNVFFPFSVIGEIPQDRKYQGEFSEVVIGDHNLFREFVTVNRGTKGGGMITRLGNHNLLMAYVHIAHDCILEDHCVLANSATLAGHVEIHSHATIGGMTGITQFNRVGAYAYIGGNSFIRKDVLPYTIGKGHEFRLQGVNLVGLRRAKIEAAVIQDIKEMFHILVTRDCTFEEAKNALRQLGTEKSHVAQVLQFCEKSQNGFYRNNTD